MPSRLRLKYACGCLFALIHANELAVAPVAGFAFSSRVTEAPRFASW